MPKLTIKKKKWFEYDDGRIELQERSPGVQAAIDAKFAVAVGKLDDKGIISTQVNFGNNFEKRAEQIIASLTDWENFYDANEQQLKCNKPNVRLFCDDVEGFVERMEEFYDSFVEPSSEEEVEALEKN